MRYGLTSSLDPRLRGDDNSVRGDDERVRGDDNSVRGDDERVHGRQKVTIFVALKLKSGRGRWRV
jgi:hypothetical protein